MRGRAAVIMLIGIMAAAPSLAVEVHRLQVDLDGDGKPETVEISTQPGQEDWLSQAVVTVGAAQYSTDFFSADGDIPEIHVIPIDRKRPQRQLLLDTPEVASCVYHVLSYVEGKLIPLLRFDSGPGCQSPQALGNGLISVFSWQGFWTKEDRYRLSGDGTTLTQEPETTYAVNVPAAAGTSFLLQGAECPAKRIEPGVYLRVSLYDSKHDRYRFQTIDGGCGWISSADLNESGPIRELPWAN